jgi:hypothetical protein
MLADSGKLTPGSNWSIDFKEYSGVDIFQAASYAIIGVTLQSTGMNSKLSGLETRFLAHICFRQHFSQGGTFHDIQQVALSFQVFFAFHLHDPLGFAAGWLRHTAFK